MQAFGINLCDQAQYFTQKNTSKCNITSAMFVVKLIITCFWNGPGDSVAGAEEALETAVGEQEGTPAADTSSALGGLAFK